MEELHRRLSPMLIALNSQVFILFVVSVDQKCKWSQDTGNNRDALFCSCYLESLWEALKAEV